ncbi:MAG TPA: type I phosphomannose isomerase catalytic subunit [Phycisphaerae bacterium]|nr:type I phosphomannose isomerase catalytic subunit [Phycisphaerae bacterium]
MRPMRMQPVMMERIWGGRRLAELFGKSLPPEVLIGEAWELADRPNAQSLVADGPLAGKTLRQVLESHGLAVVGREGVASRWAAQFGLLVKFIDASDRLSVQVHPDDARAAAHAPGQRGKTECWVVVHAEPGAWLIHGLKPGTTRRALADAVAKGRMEEFLAVRPVKKGDFVWVPPGMVHALGPGIVVAEIQSNSDLTYRLDDWGRKGPEGQPRDLHIEQALEAIRFTGGAVPSGGRGKTADERGLVIEHLVDGPAFSLSRIEVDRRPWAADTAGTCAALIVIAGAARLTTTEGATAIRAGDTVLVPADAGEYVLETPEKLVVLVAAPPGKAPAE